LPWQSAGIKFTQCVCGQKLVFSPLQEKLCAGSKNDSELSRRSLSACKFEGDRTMRAGCMSKNWCFFLCHAWSACAWGTVQTSIVWRFMGQFWCGFQCFFRWIILSDVLHSSNFYW